MGETDNLRAVKRKVADRLLGDPDVRGVSGVGTPNGRLTVYLEDDNPELRQAIEKLLKDEALIDDRTRPAFVTTGTFHAR
jgi:hypothetical protein